MDSREYNDGNDGDSHITVLEYVSFFLSSRGTSHILVPRLEMEPPPPAMKGSPPNFFFLHFNYVHTQNMLFATSEIKNTKLTICS